jgi:hypothetical protein
MLIYTLYTVYVYIYTHKQGDQNVSVHVMITVQKARKNILNNSNQLPL